MSTGPNLIDIVGEQVDLTDQSDKSMAPAIVNFSDKYVPGDMTEPDKEKLKGVLRRVFKNKNQPPPPCNGADKDLILKSLEGRLEKLRGQRNTASKVKDTAGARTTIEHIKRLCSFIDTFRKADCNDQGLVYNESSLGELTDTTVDTLLKQFIFVMLQAHMPIEDYKQFTQEAKDIIGKVGRMPSDLDEIIRKFEGKIPNRIKELIACMKMVPLNTIEKMVQDEIQLQLNKSIDKLKKVIDAKDPFWNVIGSQPTIEGVIDALLTKMKELCAKSGPGPGPGQNTEIQVLTAEIERLKGLLESLETNTTELLKRISQLEEEISKLRSTDPTLLDQLQAKNLELERLLEELLNKNNDYKAKLLFTLSPEQLAKLQANFESLQGEFDKLLQLNKQHDEKEKGLLLKLTQLEKNTSKSSDPILINANKLLKEALEKLKANDEDLQRLINILEEQLMVMQNKHAEKIRELEDQLKILEEQRSKSSDTILEKLREKDNELEAEIVKLEEQLRALKLKHKAEVESLKAEILTLKAQNEAYKAQLTELQKLNIQLEAEISRLTGIVKEKEAEIAGLLAAKKALEDNNTILLTKLTQLSSEVAALKESISDLINHYTQTKDDLEAKLAGKDAELKSLSSGATTSQKSQAELQGKIAELSKEIETLKNRIFELTEKYTKEKTQLEAQLVERNTEINALKMGSAVSKLQLEKLSSEITSLKQRIDELTVQYDATKNALNESIKEFELIGPLLDEILADLEKFKIEKDTEIDRLKKELEKCSGIAAELDRLKKEKVGLQLKIVSLEASLRNSQAKLKRLEEKSTLFDHLILETQKLETKLLANDLTNATIDSFIAALKAKEDDLRKCGEDGVKAKAAIDAITLTLTELTKEVEKKKGESIDLKTQAEKAAKEAKEAKEAAEKAAKEAANTKNAATKAAAAAAYEIAKAKQEAADAIQKAKEEAEKAVGTAQEAQKAAEAEKAASQALVTQANSISTAKQSEAEAAALAVKQAEDQLKNAQNEVTKKQAETDLKIAEANDTIKAAEARAAEAEAKAAAAEAAVLQAQAAKALVLQESSSQAEQEAASLAAAEARAEQAEAAQKVKEAEAAVALAAQQAEQSLREAAEQQSGEDKKALEEAAQRIQAAKNEKTSLETQLETLKQELEASKNTSIDREALKAIILAFANSSKSYTEFTSDNDTDPDLNTLRQVIREQLNQRNKWEDGYKSMQKGIQIIADTMNKPEWTGEDIPDNSPLKPLVNS